MADVVNRDQHRIDLPKGSGHFPKPNPDRKAIRSAGQPDRPKARALPTRKKVFDLQGEGQINPDGVRRQDELLRCEPGEPVFLRPTLIEGTARPGIDVLSARRVTIGSLHPEDAEALAPALLSERPHRAKLHSVRGGLPGYPLYGARISIAWDERAEHPHTTLDADQSQERQLRLKSRTVPGAGPRRSIGSGLFGKKRRSKTPSGPSLAAAAFIGGLALLVLLFLSVRWFGGWWCWACTS